MKLCVYGAGAIGGLIGARLAKAGYSVSAVARGATLEAIRTRGLRLSSPESDGEAQAFRIQAHDDPAALGAQDVVVLAVKTTALDSVAPAIQPLIGPDTVVLSAMNGIPWWFCHGLSANAVRDVTLTSIDPTGEIIRAIPADRVIGCVTHLSATTLEPASVRPIAGNTLIIGEPTGVSSRRLDRLAEALTAAGFDTQTTGNIHREIWYKLWGNMTVNPISAITGATGDRILDDDYVRNFMSRIMEEAAAVGARIGLPITAQPEERHAVTRKLGAFRTSMLQDAEAGRPLELDALVNAVIEIAERVGVATPWTEALFGMTRLYARTRNLYPEPA